MTAPHPPDDRPPGLRARLAALARRRLTLWQAALALAVLIAVGGGLGLAIARLGRIGAGERASAPAPTQIPAATQVARVETATPLPTGTATPAPTQPPTATVTPTPTATTVPTIDPTVLASIPTATTLPEGLPAPIYPPGDAAFGRFELGGQVNHVIDHPDQMKVSGMRWVKFQLTWEAGQQASRAWPLIEQGRQRGFKVLLSIVGGQKRPSEIDIPAYLEFLRGVAYYGPDAIEIWNEPNYYFEWPQGEVDGGNYVREMLAPAYNAIKGVNPNIMVISGAPLPTGLYYSEGGCSAEGYGCDDWLFLQQMASMGAANYMDCVGVHYNTGATSPTASTGHPADPGYQHYSWYFGSMLQLYGDTFGHKVCFTELGYLSGDGYGGVPGSFDWAADTSAAEQAAWLAEAAQVAQQSGRVRLMIVWNVDFKYWGSDDPKAGYAIIRPDGSCLACELLGRVMRSTG
jgi:hypothetical protein